jgi:hypothetical protein
LNLGLPHRVEVTAELEYLPEPGRLGDAATGLKWVSYFERLSAGIEALVLLPVSKAGGAGVETTLLATYRLEPALLHANLGGFYDARPEPVEKGWKAGLLGELDFERVKPGLEVFAKKRESEPIAAQGGAGVIVDLGPAAVRSGVHVGLTSAAPDLVTSFWVSGSLPL